MHPWVSALLFYEGISFPPSWDLALTAWAYGDIMMEMGAGDGKRTIFEFDQVASMPQGEYVRSFIERFVALDQAYISRSHESKPIQAADCLAGGVSEDERTGSNWVDAIPTDRVVHSPVAGLTQLEHALHEYESEP